MIDKSYNELRELIKVAKLNRTDPDRAKKLFDESEAMKEALTEFIGVLGYEGHSQNVSSNRSGFETAKIFMAQYVRIKGMCMDIRQEDVSIARWELRDQIIDQET